MAGLARRKLLRLLAPQTQESPVFFHLTSSDQKVFDSAIEQMSATGFDMLIYSFGSGFQLESTSAEYFAQVRANVAKAKSKGIEVGAYDLIGWSRNSNGAVPVHPHCQLSLLGLQLNVTPLTLTAPAFAGLHGARTRWPLLRSWGMLGKHLARFSH